MRSTITREPVSTKLESRARFYAKCAFAHFHSMLSTVMRPLALRKFGQFDTPHRPPQYSSTHTPPQPSHLLYSWPFGAQDERKIRASRARDRPELPALLDCMPLAAYRCKTTHESRELSWAVPCRGLSYFSTKRGKLKLSQLQGYQNNPNCAKS